MITLMNTVLVLMLMALAGTVAFSMYALLEKCRRIEKRIDILVLKQLDILKSIREVEKEMEDN